MIIQRGQAAPPALVTGGRAGRDGLVGAAILAAVPAGRVDVAADGIAGRRLLAEDR